MSIRDDHQAVDPLDLDPSQPPPPLMERAYSLASSGRFADVEEIIVRLQRDGYGYDEIFLHFETRVATRADVTRLCRQAQSDPRPVVHSRARRFELKAEECRRLADNAFLDETRMTLMRLADTYDRLAVHAAADAETEKALKGQR